MSVVAMRDLAAALGRFRLSAVLSLVTTGGRKTTLVRQLIGTDRRSALSVDGDGESFFKYRSA